FKIREKMLNRFLPYQVDDGTIFYDHIYSPPRLFVMWEGEEIDAVLPESEELSPIGVLGNVFYFILNKYKVMLRFKTFYDDKSSSSQKKT
ncbi:hypothetical protein PENTCL1PPCAC_3721, partial [Pristionchus entomophagus]